MKFLVKPINNKFEGFCFGGSHAKLDCNGQCGCNSQSGGGGSGCSSDYVSC